MFKEYLIKSKKHVPIWLKDVPISKDIAKDEKQDHAKPQSLTYYQI